MSTNWNSQLLTVTNEQWIDFHFYLATCLIQDNWHGSILGTWERFAGSGFDVRNEQSGGRLPLVFWQRNLNIAFFDWCNGWKGDHDVLNITRCNVIEFDSPLVQLIREWTWLSKVLQKTLGHCKFSFQPLVKELALGSRIQYSVAPSR